MNDVKYHHILFEGNAWESNPTTRRLRQNQHLIVPMFEELEYGLHQEIVCVPLLDRYTAQNTLKDFHPPKTYIGSIYSLITAIEGSGRHPKVSRIQKHLGEIACYALERQIPWVSDGQLSNEVGGYRA